MIWNGTSWIVCNDDNYVFSVGYIQSVDSMFSMLIPKSTLWLSFSKPWLSWTHRQELSKVYPQTSIYSLPTYDFYTFFIIWRICGTVVPVLIIPGEMYQLPPVTSPGGGCSPRRIQLKLGLNRPDTDCRLQTLCSKSHLDFKYLGVKK